MSLKGFLLLTLVALVTSQAPNPTVRLLHGALQGAWRVSSQGRSFASFTGVPYARPPVGKYRFREPQQLKPWTGVWDATKRSTACLQYDPFAKVIAGSENCLFLNVYTPKLQAGAKMPVLVYIHGGAFMFGSGVLYGPDHLMNRDMVVVTVNYRLGPLGFLSTEDEVVPGNNGLKDQSFALHWVKNNIMLFGGDPDNVIISGGSAGSASMHYHLLSPLSRGTFAKGIGFSGSALSPWTLATKPAEKAKTLGSLIGCPTGNSLELVECLKYRPAEAIATAQMEMMDWRVHMFTMFTPVVEPKGVRDAFLQEYPYLATKNGRMMNVPLIAGVTEEEGLYPAAAYQADPTILPELEANWEQLASDVFIYNDTLPLSRRSEVAKAIKQQYLGGEPVSQKTYRKLVGALSDRLFVADVGKMAQFHAVNSGQPTYVYRYAYRGRASLSNVMAHNNEDYGVSHADDVLMVFKSPRIDTSPDAAMIEELVDMVYTFSTTGTPKAFGGANWPPVKPGVPELDYLHIFGPKKTEMESTTDFGNKAFWLKLGFNENENYKVAKDEL